MGGRKVKCQVCSWSKFQFYGHGILTKPCPKCGSCLTFAEIFPGDPAVTPDPKVNILIKGNQSINRIGIA